MNPLQTEILRNITRLTLGASFRNPAGEVAWGVRESIPLALLWIEYWHLSHMSMLESEAGPSAFKKALESLEAQDYIVTKPSSFFFPEGTHYYRTFDRQRWRLEHRALDEHRRLKDGELLVLEKCRSVIVAAPVQSWNEMEQYLTKNPSEGATNLFTLYGMRFDARDHSHFSITDKGWEHSQLGVEHILDGSRHDANGGTRTERPDPSLSPHPSETEGVPVEETRIEKSVQPKLEIDGSARTARWNGKRLGINSHADFAVLARLLEANGAIVSYINLFRAMKPTEVAESVEELTEAPPEVREAASHIRAAMKAIGCPHEPKNVRMKGYRLRSPDE